MSKKDRNYVAFMLGLTWFLLVVLYHSEPGKVVFVSIAYSILMIICWLAWCVTERKSRDKEKRMERTSQNGKSEGS